MPRHFHQGPGATFRAYFPGVEADVSLRATEPQQAPEGRGQRVLYLDDEASLVNLTARLLARSGYEVEGFARPADALAAFTADPTRFDVVVSDMNMPTATGLSVAAEILRQRPDMPVALISGFVTDELAARADALGAAPSSTSRTWPGIWSRSSGDYWPSRGRGGRAHRTQSLGQGVRSPARRSDTRQMVIAIAEAVGREVAFIDVPPEPFAGVLTAAGVPPWQVDGLLDDYAHAFIPS